MRRSPFLLIYLAMAPFLAGCGGAPATVVNNNIAVTVSPARSTLQLFVQQTFTATVTGTTNQAVTWQVNGMTHGSAITGTISASGVYSAPHFLSSTIIPAAPSSAPTTVTVTAITQASAAATGSAVITLIPQQQDAQTGAIELGTSGGNVHASSTSGAKITCCGGTLGSLLVRNGSFFILSNNHVLDDSDLASVGDAIIQPALIDTGSCTSAGATTVANLTQSFMLEGSPPNPVDAAISQIVPGKVDTSGNILLLGSSADANGVPLAGAPHAGSGIAVVPGDNVAKSGRSSGLTCSTIGSVSDSFSVVYTKGCGTGSTFTVVYSNQISISGGEFSSEGDSGSLIVTQGSADPVALLFAGSSTDTVGNPIGAVLQAMKDASNNVPTVVGGAAHQVIGCTLPGPNSATSTLPSVIVTPELNLIAVAARDTHAKELLGIAGVRGVGVGASLDHAGQPALLLFVAPGTLRAGLPAQIDGVRTRIVESSSESARGILSGQEASPLAPSESAFAVSSLSTAELLRAKTVHKVHVDEWMKQPGVQGFGVTSSADSPGEAALIVFLIQGVPHNPIPPLIDGVRTRVRESSRFHAGFNGSSARRGCGVPKAKAGTAKAPEDLPLAK